jgi:CRP-like cAMP-binding protein
MVLSMMSLPTYPSAWPPPGDDDRVQLKAATQRGDAWNTLYHAKRLLQLNAMDREVEVILRQLRPFDFWHQAAEDDPASRAVNPFFGYLQARSLREVIRSSQLVERGYNQALCRYGDEGHAMFLILRGQVGVYNSEGASSRIGRPEFTMGVGEIAGELAFLLDRERTADLVALSDVALLSFSFQELSRQLASTPGSEDVIELVQRFMAQRILQHVGHNSDFLIGSRGDGPLTDDLMPAESLLDDLHAFCRVVSLTAIDGNFSLQTLRQGGAGGAGVFFLVSGSVTSKTSPGKSLSGSDFPVIFVDWHPTLLGPDHEYAVEAGKAKLLQISQEGLDQLPDVVRQGLGRRLRSQIARSYVYDAFLSYNLGDEVSVQYWKEALEECGLKVYVDLLRPGVRFTSGIQRALLNSLTHLVFVSPHAMIKASESNWVLKEVEFRETNMRHPWIVPVALRGGDLDRFGLKYTAVDATGDPGKAISEVVELVRELRSGERKPPVLENRTLAQQLG